MLLIVAGPNGSGKTTVTVRLKQERWSEDVVDSNPDDIARERLGDWNSEDAVRRAADWTQARRETLCARTQDGLLRKIYGELPAWVAAAVEPLPRHPDFIDARTP
ncbi:hypothetical protein [Pendulispora albinea]|uniref:hypothetical protein n=1 Tax=Pendulispora albinea TaxID=2741071 RepID=UPI00374E1BAB